MMTAPHRIVVLNGSPDPDRFALDAYLASMTAGLTRHGHEVRSLTLRDLKTKDCVGCFNCWVKTPGNCVLRDDGDYVRWQVLRADLLLFASPLIVGHVSAILKRSCDTLIPLMHPYIEVLRGECHHRKRYDKYPDIGLLIEPSPDDTDEDLAIVVEAYERLALNFHSRLAISATTAQPKETLLHAFDNHSRLASRAA